jgi:hypothetical protein
MDLAAAHIAPPEAFKGVEIRWCHLRSGKAITPEFNRIYLDSSLENNRRERDLVLTHELIHINQFSRMGSNAFKCQYSQELISCGGCQDRRNSFEREAIDFAQREEGQLDQFLQSGGDNSNKPMTSGIGGGLPRGAMMAGCGCPAGPTPASVPEQRCASGVADAFVCRGSCRFGVPVSYFCR